MCMCVCVCVCVCVCKELSLLTNPAILLAAVTVKAYDIKTTVWQKSIVISRKNIAMKTKIGRKITLWAF